jgi:NitT/TauT family transport system substrate-binding protein
VNWRPAISIAAIAIIVLLGLAAVVLLPVPSPAGTIPDPLRIGGPALEQNALIYVAADKGYFAKNGLNVTVRDDYPTGVGPVSDMEAGTIDLSLSSEYPVITRIFAGGNISVIATIDKFQNEKLISRRDSGIRQIADLKGKRIGLPRSTILEFFLGRLLELNGMTIRDVMLVDINTTYAPDAIANGDVDAIMYFQPHVFRILDRLGDNAVTWPGQSNQSLYGVVAARNDWIAGHPGQVGRFLQSLEEAREFSVSHPAETRAIVKKRLNLTDEYLAEVWPEHQFDLSLDQSLLVAMNDEARWTIANNMTPAKTLPDFREAISLSGLEKIRPESVNIR